jgi:hypothetical protein
VARLEKKVLGAIAGGSKLNENVDRADSGAVGDLRRETLGTTAPLYFPCYTGSH